MISQERLEKALRLLAESDEPVAELKTEMERQSILRKRARATIIVHEDGAMPVRQAKAEEHPDVQAVDDAYLMAYGAHEVLRNRRATESIVIEVWRSLNAQRRNGNVI